MAIETHLDEIIKYKEIVKDMLSNSQMVLALIANDPNLKLDSNQAVDVSDQHIFDYDYIDGTQTQVGAFIMIDVDMIDRATPNIKDLVIYVQVVVSKSYMDLKGSGFLGMKGNRRDNISRFADLCINNSTEFGIGRIGLDRAISATVPDTYTSKLLTYSIPDFARNRSVGNR